MAAPTEFNGTTFRSRTEARWAVFFSVLKVPYQYEAFSFHFPQLHGPNDPRVTRYTPDFYLPNAHLWIEIKGREPTPKEIALAKRLAKQTQEPVFIYIGFPQTKGRQPAGVIEVDAEGVRDSFDWNEVFEIGGGVALLEWFPYLQSAELFWRAVDMATRAFRAPAPRNKALWRKPDESTRT